MPRYQILYARRPTFHASGEIGTARLTVTEMQSTHVRLCEVEADSLDDAWRQMQAEHWSPNGEARGPSWKPRPDPHLHVGRRRDPGRRRHLLGMPRPGLEACRG